MSPHSPQQKGRNCAKSGVQGSSEALVLWKWSCQNLICLDGNCSICGLSRKERTAKLEAKIPGAQANSTPGLYGQAKRRAHEGLGCATLQI